MYELSPVIHGTVTGDSDDDTAGGNNHFRPALWRCTNAKTLPICATEMDERIQAYRKWREQQILDDHVTVSNFRIGANNAGRCSLHIARRHRFSDFFQERPG